MSTSESEGSNKRPRPCFYEARVGYQDIGIFAIWHVNHIYDNSTLMETDLLRFFGANYGSAELSRFWEASDGRTPQHQAGGQRHQAIQTAITSVI